MWDTIQQMGRPQLVRDESSTQFAFRTDLNATCKKNATLHVHKQFAEHPNG